MEAKVGDLIRRWTDGVVGEVVEAPKSANFVRADMPDPYTGGTYQGVSVKDYTVVEPCPCCDSTGYRPKED